MKYIVELRYIALAVCAALLLQGCDWVKGKMGLPTSEEIARMKVELQQQQERETAEAARVQRLQDSIKAMEAEAALHKVSGYYVVLGSFKDFRNADALVELVKGHGYAAEAIMLKSGYKMVAIGGFGTFSDAYREMEKIGEKDFCPYDMWVYSAAQQLHE